MGNRYDAELQREWSRMSYKEKRKKLRDTSAPLIEDRDKFYYTVLGSVRFAKRD